MIINHDMNVPPLEEDEAFLNQLQSKPFGNWIANINYDHFNAFQFRFEGLNRFKNDFETNEWILLLAEFHSIGSSEKDSVHRDSFIQYSSPLDNRMHPKRNQKVQQERAQPESRCVPRKVHWNTNFSAFL